MVDHYYIAFMNVSQFISHKPDPNREIMIILHSWVLELGRYAEQKISNSSSYFSFFGPPCYLGPYDNGVELGFAKGYILSDDGRLFESKEHKKVKSSTAYGLNSLEEQEESICHLLNETAILNEYRFKRKTAKKK